MVDNEVNINNLIWYCLSVTVPQLRQNSVATRHLPAASRCNCRERGIIPHRFSRPAGGGGNNGICHKDFHGGRRAACCAYQFGFQIHGSPAEKSPRDPGARQARSAGPHPTVLVSEREWF